MLPKKQQKKVIESNVIGENNILCLRVKLLCIEGLNLDSKNMEYRINTDGIVSRMGSWKDNKLQMQACKEAVKLINKYLEEGSTFHQEATLADKIILKTIEKAKECVEISVAKGGHGIEPKTLEKSYC